MCHPPPTQLSYSPYLHTNISFKQTCNIYGKIAIITILAEINAFFYKHELVPDNCTEYEQNHHILLQDITALKMYEKIAVITQIWHIAKFYLNCTSIP